MGGEGDEKDVPVSAKTFGFSPLPPHTRPPHKGIKEGHSVARTARFATLQHENKWSVQRMKEASHARLTSRNIQFIGQRGSATCANRADRRY